MANLAELAQRAVLGHGAALVAGYGEAAAVIADVGRRYVVRRGSIAGRIGISEAGHTRRVPAPILTGVEFTG